MSITHDNKRESRSTRGFRFHTRKFQLEMTKYFKIKFPTKFADFYRIGAAKSEN